MAQKVRFRDRLRQLFKQKPSSSTVSSETSIILVDAPTSYQNAPGSAATPSVTSSVSQRADSQQKTLTAPPPSAGQNTAEPSHSAPSLDAAARSTIPATGQTTLVRDDTSEARPAFGPERPPQQQQGKQMKKLFGQRKKERVPSDSAEASSSKEQRDSKAGDVPEFRLRVDKTFWPAFDPGEGDGTLTGSGSLFYDFASGLHGQWGRGADFGPGYFGNQLFYSEKWASGSEYPVPSRLYDLQQRRVVESQEVGSRVRYAVVSHVWGRTRNVDGDKYGVDWKIPIRSEDKLVKILEAARVVIGERYIWMDVLCLDQRRKNELEIAQMKAYFGNATGCLVWLDDAFEEGNWNEILGAIKEINRFFRLDEYSVPTVSVASMFGPDSSFLERKFGSVEAFRWIGKILLIEKAPWFKRVWTLQEGVIPDNVFFCTPERYMTSASTFFQTVGLCEQIAKLFLDMGLMEGLAINSELQKSELYKTLKLRQLYRTGDISFWHLVQAVRSRECTYEQDRVFGVCGLVHGTIPIINYDRSVQGLLDDLFKAYVDDGDFSACLFVGGRSLTPDKDISMGYINPGAPRHDETHLLVLAENGLRMADVGFDWVTRVYCIYSYPSEGKLFDWSKHFSPPLSTDTETQKAMASAWGMPTDTMKIGKEDPMDIVIGAWAAWGSMSGLGTSEGGELIMKAFGDEFTEAYHQLVPQALLTWTKTIHLTLDRDDSSIVLIWSAHSEVQVAVVSEPVEGRVMVVTPSSYAEHQGRGCLICQQLPNGSIRKIGIGLGKAIKAASKGTFLMTV